MSWLVRVEAPYYCAGFIVEDAWVAEAAPILRWAVGRRGRDVVEYLRKKGFKVTFP